MVKCKDGPYVCHEQHAEIVAALAADKQAADRATFDAIRAFTVLKDENAALAAENERLRKAAQQVELAWSHYENGLIETPEWVKRGQVRDAVTDLRVAAKGVQS